MGADAPIPPDLKKILTQMSLCYMLVTINS